jgi:hypothetical protein
MGVWDDLLRRTASDIGADQLETGIAQVEAKRIARLANTDQC